ncbi:hypothetical protein EU545_03750 [Candidatus Thorarchaeota archaeon]|nr:MAG: hypothetical protein EU545_03750 [Candidatus Thorarchaeota archaeon]
MSPDASVGEFRATTAEFSNNSLSFLSNEDLIYLPGAGTQENPHRLEDVKVWVEPPCLWIRGITSHLLIQNCTFVANSTDSAAVLIEDSQNVILQGVEVYDGYNGISLAHTNSCVVRNCNITDATEGITSILSTNNTLEDNDVFRNTMGVMLYSTNETVVKANRVYGNSQWGIQVDSFSLENRLYYNLFGWNANWRSISGQRNAADHGTNNTWDDGIARGNNYTGYDGEPPQPIGGTARSVDRFPSGLVDSEAPDISTPEDISFAEGESGNAITWTAQDMFPAEYNVWENGKLYATGYWYSNISVNLDGLSVGVHNMTIEVLDYADNAGYSQAFVYVSVSFLQGAGADIIVASSVLSVVAVAVVIGGFKRFR